MSTTSKTNRDPALRPPDPSGNCRQVGPWSPDETLLLQLVPATSGPTDPDARDLIRLAATAGNTNLTRYRTWAEYWRTGDLALLSSLRIGQTFHLIIGSEKCDDRSIDAFFDGYREAPAVPEIALDWSEGSYRLPDGAVSHVFSMPDLDPAAQGRRVGFSLVVSDGALIGIGWHKSFVPETGLAWQPPALGPLRQYVAYNGTTPGSLDVPADTQWYYVYQP